MSTTSELTRTHVFSASRWTGGNFWFPARIRVDPDRITRSKGRLFGADEETISMGKVASVHIKSGILFAEILIESSGGADPMRCTGFSKGDARQVRDLIERYQQTR